MKKNAETLLTGRGLSYGAIFSIIDGTTLTIASSSQSGSGV
jgi:hypothetical protein